MGQKENHTESELNQLRRRIAELEQLEEKHKLIVKELKAANQQLDAANQQLKAGEQQLKACNEQLQAVELEIRANEAAAQSARKFAENIIDTIRHPLLVLDENLVVISANRFFYNTFKVEEKETTGNKLYDLGNKQWNIPKLEKLLKKTLPQKSTVDDFEVTHTFEKIGEKTMLLNARELNQEQDKKRLILLAFEDITHRKKFETEMQHLNTELQQRAYELQQILYITTHDLRSPLVNIQGFNKEMEASLNELNQVLNNEKIPAEIKSRYSPIINVEIPEALHYITSGTTKMDKLLSGLLALSRLGRQKVTFRTLNMNDLLNNVLDTFEFEIGKNQVKIEVSELPVCKGDDMQINQLFSNIIGNSLKFLDPGRPGKITISGQKENGISKYIVEDNGIGISENYQKKVFELFQKLDPKKPGIGLGMNIVKQIVEKHNGDIQLESELGKGTKFIVFLPD
ncbi:MAG: ATP-binding protein [Prolixibacteraceae bacterium]